MRRSAALIAAVAATGLSLGTGPRAEAQSPLRIGVSLSQTGPFAALGQHQLRGYQLRVKDANEKGGVLGRRIELPGQGGLDPRPVHLAHHRGCGRCDREAQDTDGGANRRRHVYLQEGPRQSQDVRGDGRGERAHVS